MTTDMRKALTGAMRIALSARMTNSKDRQDWMEDMERIEQVARAALSSREAPAGEAVAQTGEPEGEWPDDYLPILTRKALYGFARTHRAQRDALQRELESCRARIHNQREEINRLAALPTEASPQVQKDSGTTEGEPVATLHDDGCFTWKRDEYRLKYDRQRAGWRMDVYATPTSTQRTAEVPKPVTRRELTDLILAVVEDVDRERSTEDSWYALSAALDKLYAAPTSTQEE